MDKQTVEQLMDEMLARTPCLKDSTRSYLFVIAIGQPPEEFSESMTRTHFQHWRGRLSESLQGDINHYILQHARAVELLGEKEVVYSYDLMEFTDESKDVSIDSVREKLEERTIDVENVALSDFSATAVQEFWMLLDDTEDTLANPGNTLVGLYTWDSGNIFDNDTTVYNLEELAFELLAGAKRD